MSLNLSMTINLDEETINKLFIKGCLNKVKFYNLERVNQEIDKWMKVRIVRFYYHCPFCNLFHLTSRPPNEDFSHEIRKALIERFNKGEFSNIELYKYTKAKHKRKKK